MSVLASIAFMDFMMNVSKKKTKQNLFFIDGKNSLIIFYFKRVPSSQLLKM